MKLLIENTQGGFVVKRTMIIMLLLAIALFSFGCCGGIDKAKEMAEQIEETAKAAGHFAEEIEKLQDGDGNFTLTQSRIDMFIKEFPTFKEVMEEKAKKVEESDDDDFGKAMSSIGEFTDIEESLLDAGVKNPAEFYLTMIEVTAGFFVITSENVMKDAKGAVSQQIDIMKEQLENPDLPKEQKEALETTIEELEEAQDEETEMPEDITKSELELVRKNYDIIAKTLGMEIVDSL